MDVFCTIKAEVSKLMISTLCLSLYIARYNFVPFDHNVVTVTVAEIDNLICFAGFRTVCRKRLPHSSLLHRDVTGGGQSPSRAS